MDLSIRQIALNPATDYALCIYWNVFIFVDITVLHFPIMMGLRLWHIPFKVNKKTKPAPAPKTPWAAWLIFLYLRGYIMTDKLCRIIPRQGLQSLVQSV